MDPRKQAQEILRTTKPPRRRRAAHGQWSNPAKVVVELVQTGEWNVSDAIREVIVRNKFAAAESTSDEGLQEYRRAFDGIRAAYYIATGRRKKPARKGRKPDDFQL